MKTHFFGGWLVMAVAASCVANGAEAPPPAVAAETAKIVRTHADLKTLHTALLSYKLLAGVFPTEAQGLASLVQKPVLVPVPRRWIQLMKEIPKDPWERDFRYIMRKSKTGQELHVIISDGPDAGKAGDDIELILDPEIT